MSERRPGDRHRRPRPDPGERAQDHHASAGAPALPVVHIADHDLVRLRPRADRVILSQGDTVLCSALDGGLEPVEECGLFVHETRLLSRYRCRILGHRLHLSAQSHVRQDRWLAYFLVVPEGGRLRDCAQDAIELRWGHAVGGGLHEDLDLANYSRHPVALRLALRWQADFADLGETQSHRRQHGRLSQRWRRGERAALWWVRYGKDRRWQHQGQSGRAAIDRRIELRLRCDARIARLDRHGIVFELALAPGERWHACLEWRARIDGARLHSPPCPCAGTAQSAHPEAGAEPPPDEDELSCDMTPGQDPTADTADFLRQSARMGSQGSGSLAPVVAATLERARRDLASLRLRRLDRAPQRWTVAAGAPSYAAFFGRDAALAAWQSAVLGPQLLDGTLEVLRDTQGRREDDWRDEQPGRLIHEMRSGPLAALRYTPFGRYYGALNSSTLFPIVLLHAWRWHGDRERVAGSLDAAVAALEWLEREARQGAHGFYAYATRSRQGLDNQSWKDSGDALVHPDGSPVEQPAASCEEQAEAYRAQLSLALLLAQFGRPGPARRWYRRAQALRRRFEQAFWSERHRYYAMALDRQGRAVHSAASNPLHCLATGIASPERAQAVMARLLEDDLFSGWGVRTLSCRHPAYNPYAYHRGTVWPAEHGPLVEGAMRYGLRAQAQAICRAQFEAAALFDHNRLPECFAGHPRDRAHPFPGLYPYANTPQAWSATTALSLAQALCGLQADAPRQRLWIDPHLPHWLPTLDLIGLQVGQSRLDLHLARCADGRTDWSARVRQGSLEVRHRSLAWPRHDSLEQLVQAESAQD